MAYWNKIPRHDYLYNASKTHGMFKLGRSGIVMVGSCGKVNPGIGMLSSGSLMLRVKGRGIWGRLGISGSVITGKLGKLNPGIGIFSSGSLMFNERPNARLGSDGNSGIVIVGNEIPNEGIGIVSSGSLIEKLQRLRVFTD